MWVLNHRFIIATCVLIQNVCGDIVRYEDGTFEATFSVEYPARMGGQTVLAYFHNIGLYDCTIKCVQWIQCMTVNYSFKQGICELVDSDFDEFETDGPFPDPEWINLGTPKRIDGEYSSWKNATSCSVSCGDGTQRQFRECDNPRPQHGGEDCKGARVKNVHCNLIACPVCYGAKHNTFGTIKVRATENLKSIRLTHVSGWVSCVKSEAKSVWGCAHTYLPIIATLDKKEMIFPVESLDKYRAKLSSSGYDMLHYEILYDWNSVFTRKNKLGIWFYEDFANAGARDNSGNKHCVRVDIEYQ